MVEKTLKTKLSAITGLSGKVFPVAAPEGCKPPYLIYEQSAGSDFDDLSGGLGLREASYDIHIVHDTYANVKSTTISVITALRALQFSTESNIYYQAVTVEENSPELYEFEINCYRKIITAKFMI